ncbi:MAG: divergent polysaccharide deacetylase family protein [Sulfurospirillaceae bacterium]|nr:divergent polysaccharide deacetylase family protein [Sulfurospirillaceae bacterium]
MTRKKKKHPRTKKNISRKKTVTKNRLFYIATISVLLFLGFVFYKYAYLPSQKHQVSNVSVQNEKSTKELMDKMKHMLEVENKRVREEINASKRKEPVVEKPIKQIEKIIASKKEVKTQDDSSKQHYLSEAQDFKKNSKQEEANVTTEKSVKYKGMPRLAIIIDDVSFPHEVKRIQEIPYKVTPSFFPPTKVHPETVKLSNEFSICMLHLPLEAMSYPHPEPQTLLASDSRDTIYKRIKSLKSEFPHIKYYNNHTGSKFTADEQAMEKLISVMHGFGLHFVDSRTTAATKAKEVSKKLHLKLISRDIFLDNTTNPKDIISQLKKAVEIAKKRGYAVAIGHPHKNTLKVLIGAKKYLRGVRMVYINEI